MSCTEQILLTSHSNMDLRSNKLFIENSRNLNISLSSLINELVKQNFHIVEDRSDASVILQIDISKGERANQFSLLNHPENQKKYLSEPIIIVKIDFITNDQFSNNKKGTYIFYIEHIDCLAKELPIILDTMKT